MPTSPRSRGTSRAEERSQRFHELLTVHRTKFLAGLLALVLLAGGGWFYRRSVALKRERAETAYFRAREAFEAKNFALAESDLRNVVARYKGTTGGAQAAMTLAQVLYETGKYQEAFPVLREAARSAPNDLVPNIEALLAAGYENLRQFDEAASAYLRAAEAARFPKDRLGHRANAARAYMGAGKNAEALAIWRELEAEPTQFLAAEARVRIGELTAQPGS